MCTSTTLPRITSHNTRVLVGMLFQGKNTELRESLVKINVDITTMQDSDVDLDTVLVWMSIQGQNSELRERLVKINVSINTTQKPNNNNPNITH